jgi:hypothetical protein
VSGWLLKKTLPSLTRYRWTAVASEPCVKLLAEVGERPAKCLQPKAQLDHINPANASLDLADQGLVFAQSRGELLLAYTCADADALQLCQEVLVVVGVDGLLHRRANKSHTASNPCWNMRTSLVA